MLCADAIFQPINVPAFVLRCPHFLPQSTGIYDFLQVITTVNDILQGVSTEVCYAVVNTRKKSYTIRCTIVRTATKIDPDWLKNTIGTCENETFRPTLPFHFYCNSNLQRRSLDGSIKCARCRSRLGLGFISVFFFISPPSFHCLLLTV